MKFLVSVVFWLFTAHSFAIDSAKVQWNQFLNSYSKQVERKLKEKSIPGAALSIVHGELGDYAKGYGITKVRKGRAVDAHTRFRLASVSKTFAGSLSAKLASENKLLLDDYVSDYLPAFADSEYKHLKLYHLLSHSSGLVPNAYDNLIESRMPYQDIVERLILVEKICRPGQCYGYQNVMFSIIADVILKATGMPYEQWLKEFVFTPLNMNDGGVGLANMTRDTNYALPHVLGRKRWHTAKLKANYYKVAPAAGVNASAADMVQWLKLQLGYYPSVMSLEALTIQSRPYTRTKRELRRRIWREHVTQAYYGLGWRIYEYKGTTLYYHSGWVQGYRTDVVVIPAINMGFSLLLNAESGVINALTTDFINSALQFAQNAPEA
ncbi:serine hydrolase domain-containing protein [Pseudoalteromonas aurantia]|uniref:Serine hydrolase n=1 Tax=Pseudoalteromonas aurantia TaxID=43654 RepID=A0A5S3VD60_9GAMM|nr:serine hydrolase domain-containing protein [Pseudoalteromonas aurantia]TMO63320.1 serine hydrolase [Pseudoalteromonas aurantia]TMO69539.1 serine hydrolase [Pseudoalteromonas aurantia]TMO74361.1 serine hydrolase [Pseudoalteromonas aurantia]